MNTVRSPAPGASLFNLGPAGNNVVSNISRSMVNATNTVSNAANTAMNTVSNVATGSRTVLMIVFAVLILVFALFWKQISHGFAVLYDKLRQALGATPAPTPIENKEDDVTQPPIAPQDNTIQEQKLVEKILPGRKQVFNISKNSYTYYDAEPLCKALGAELATYEQVKQSYADGADWCNYGWVKGQMAVYPTQTNTWEQLQQGPEEQRNVCGRPGLNGGFFDNPELQFGVNCYGVKPEQKDHDATAVASGDAAPLSPGALEFEKKAAKYRGEANSIGILPFNRSAWSY